MAAEPALATDLAASRDRVPQHSRQSSTRRTRSLSTGRMLEDAAAPRGAGNLLKRFGLAKFARRTLGIMLLSVTVLLWTVSNFLASVSSMRLPFIGRNSSFAGERQ